jgi:hypothetical protein
MPSSHSSNPATDLRWAQLSSRHARHLLLAASYCAPGQPIPDRLLRRATRLPPEAYRHARNLLCHLGLLQFHHPGPFTHGRQKSGRNCSASPATSRRSASVAASQLHRRHRSSGPSHVHAGISSPSCPRKCITV